MSQPLPGEPTGHSGTQSLNFRLSSGKQRPLRIAGWLACVCGVAAGLVLLIHPPSGPGDPHAGERAFGAFGLLVGVLAAVIAERRVRVSVTATTEALVVRNSVRTYTIAWADISGYADAGVKLKGVRLRDHHLIKMQGMDPGWFGNMDPAIEKIAQLQAYQARLSQNPSSTAPPT